MGQAVSVRTNQDFGVNYESGKLIPQTEVIILVDQPKYTYKKGGDKIVKGSEIVEVRFKTGSEALNHLIGQLQHAQRVAVHFETMAGQMNEIIVNTPRPADV